jgi:hypothetical protein
MNGNKVAEKPKTNLFASAKKVDTKKENKSKVPNLLVTPELEEQLRNYVEAKAQCKDWQTKKAIAEGFIKEKATELYLAECKKNERNIGSFKLGDVTVSVQDRYAKLDEDIAAIVAENFPNVVEKTTEYLFNQEILRKYIEQISEALQKADIPEDELGSLIQAKEVIAVKKGTIDTLPTYGDRMPDLFQAISPIISMR